MDNIKSFFESIKDINWSNLDWDLLKDWKYLTDKTPNSEFIFAELIVLFAIIFLVFIGVYFFYLKDKMFLLKPKERWFSSLAAYWGINSLVLLLYVFFRTEEVALVSMRLLLLILIAVYVGVMAYGIVDYYYLLPEKIRHYYAAKTRDKYLPKKKKKKRK